MLLELDTDAVLMPKSDTITSPKPSAKHQPLALLPIQPAAGQLVAALKRLVCFFLAR
jgi:hypothetical protein